VSTSVRIGFGTGGLLRIGSERGRRETLAAALANGIRHFDTAPIYGFGESERTLGRFLHGRRSEVTVTTKFGLRPSALAVRLAPFQRIARKALRLLPALRGAAVRGSGALYAAPKFDAAEVRAGLESSLRALRTDYVDFYLAHQAHPEALPGPELIGLLGELQRVGKIRAYGVATEFDWLPPVLEQRPELGRVVQFDCDPNGQNARALSGSAELMITYGLLSRGLATLRSRLGAPDGAVALAPAAAELARLEDDTLGALLLRAMALANPRGIVLMQSRSVTRIERNVRAVSSDRDDFRVQQILTLLGPER
jgi:aryl-alcohol dehydrogenase-like predicted oxidoreductase